MEIQYIWIENYRSIEKQGFNFGGKYIFDFNSETGELLCTENDEFIANFFGNKVSNITAFIGANGSGKSTILDFIKLNISVDIGNTNLRYLCLYKEKGREKIFIYNSIVRKLKLPKGKESLFEITDRGRIDNCLTSLLFPTAFIFYSPSIDLNTEQNYTRIDLSTTKLLRESKRQANDVNNFANSFDEFADNEMRFQMGFASKFKNHLPFTLPEELQMNPHNMEESHILSALDISDPLISELNKRKKEIEAELYELRDKNSLFTVEIYRALFWQTIYFLLKQSRSKEVLETLSEQTKNHLNTTWDLLRALYSNQTFQLPQWDRVEKFFDILKQLETDKIMIYYFARFNFKIRGDSNFSKVIAFLNAYNNIAVIGNFISFYWSGLSTGEQTMFSMYARFFKAREDLSDLISHTNECRINAHDMPVYHGVPDVVVLIDEGEVHMHPQWQKEFVHNLIKVLPIILNVPKIQLIFASNSPFLISDLPHYNIVFLDSNKGKTFIRSGQPTSYAANIHELLATSFFMDVPIGKFAESKIDEILGWLNEDKLLSLAKTIYIKKVIRLIDDPLVQNKIIQLLSLKAEGGNWERYLLEQQQKLINDRLNRLDKRKHK